MSVSTSRNLSGPLERVTAACRAAESCPLRPVPEAGRVDQLAAYIDLALDEPTAVRKVRDAVAELAEASHLHTVLPRAVETATALMGAEFGNIQVVDPRDGSLVLVTQSGFGTGFLDHFAVVSDDGSVCGQAARQSAQAVVTDVRDDSALAQHQKVFRTAGVRAVQSTPLVDHAGRLIGMISTHAAQPGRPSDRDLRLMELYAGLVGEVVARHLGGASYVTDGLTGSPLGAPAWAERSSIEPLTRQILSDTINRIFSAGLRFAGTLPLFTEDGLAARRVQAGIDELDETIHAIQRAALDLSTSHGPPDSRTVRGGHGPDIPAASSRQQGTAPS